MSFFSITFDGFPFSFFSFFSLNNYKDFTSLLFPYFSLPSLFFLFLFFPRYKDFTSFLSLPFHILPFHYFSFFSNAQISRLFFSLHFTTFFFSFFSFPNTYRAFTSFLLPCFSQLSFFLPFSFFPLILTPLSRALFLLLFTASFILSFPFS